MKVIEKLARRFTKTASTTVKSEVKKTAIDLLPTVTGIVSAIVGFLLFHEAVETQSETKSTITNRNTNITRNNYFFGSLSEESIRKIIEEDKR